jgi:predicted negative regulator of RcsB-dependent stress response
MVDEYLDEREQAEQLKQWFKENWLWLATGIALGLGGLYGWQGWNAHLDGRSREASARFGEMLQAFDRADRERGNQLAAEITGEYASTPYADQTELVLARVEVDAGELDAAATRLRQVMEQSKDPELALVARLRLARVQIAQAAYDAALATLDGATAPAVAATTAELRGDALLAKGDPAAALAAYRQALEAAGDDARPGLVDPELLRLKIDDLAAAAAPDGAAAGAGS